MTESEGRWRLGRVWHIDDLVYDVRLGREPGVYLFYRTYVGPPRYVGRSDTDLHRRMRNRPYVYYQFKPCASPADAYRWECLYYHRYYDTLDNRIHPARPAAERAICPICQW